MRQNIISTLAVLFSFAFVFLAYGANWTPPTESFPGGNPALPLDTSSNTQVKTGLLKLKKEGIPGAVLDISYESSISGTDSSNNQRSVFFPFITNSKTGALNQTKIWNLTSALLLDTKGVILPNLTLGDFVGDGGVYPTNSGMVIYDKNKKAILYNDGTNWNELEKKVAAGVARIWGEGRPGVVRHTWTLKRQGFNPTTVDWECSATPSGIKAGRGNVAVYWDSVGAGCPSGTWACSRADFNSMSCDETYTSSNVPSKQITFPWRACGDSSNATNDAWLADVQSNGRGDEGSKRDSRTGSMGSQFICSALPVWCCSN